MYYFLSSLNFLAAALTLNPWFLLGGLGLLAVALAGLGDDDE
jgi:hypothetical protein